MRAAGLGDFKIIPSLIQAFGFPTLESAVSEQSKGLVETGHHDVFWASSTRAVVLGAHPNICVEKLLAEVRRQKRTKRTIPLPLRDIVLTHARPPPICPGLGRQDPPTREQPRLHYNQPPGIDTVQP